MNSDTLLQLLQKGFRVSLGATASLIEILQDPLKRDANLSRLQTELAELAEEWAEKGEMTEQEARHFVETILNQQQASTPGEAGQATERSSSPTTSPDVQADLQELTNQIAAIRAELERLRNAEPPAS